MAAMEWNLQGPIVIHECLEAEQSNIVIPLIVWLWR